MSAGRDELVVIFKAAWHLADSKGETGHRTEAGIDAVLAYLGRPAQQVCGQSALLSSHGGGNDYSAPCLKVTDAKGRHKGPHRDHLGHEWQESVR